MSDYTPGPWRVGTNGPNGLLTVGTERGLMVAMVAHSIYVPDQAEQARGDARLISAAPDLLAAAEGVLPWLAGINTKGDPDVVDALTNVHGQLAAAIKKAKASRRATTTDAQSVTELDGGHATAILECSSVKTREEIEHEYVEAVRRDYKIYLDAYDAHGRKRDAALAELDRNRGARTGGTGVSEARLSPDEIEALRDEHREEKWSIDRDGLSAQLDSECFACCEPWPCDVARLLATYDDILLRWRD